MVSRYAPGNGWGKAATLSHASINLIEYYGSISALLEQARDLLIRAWQQAEPRWIRSVAKAQRP